MSPVLVPRNYTKSFIDGQVESVAQEQAITEGIGAVNRSSEITLCEGTGHVGVGAIIGLSNAAVAKAVGADVVLVANGGIGSAFDELEMNRAVLKESGVRLRGVVVNKVVPDKVDMIRDYFGRAIKERWGVPLLGVVPDLPFLGKATLGDIERLLGAELIAGQRFREAHYGTDDLQCVTTAVRRFLRKTNWRQQSCGERRPLFVTHITRDDIILGFLSHYQRNVRDDGRHGWLGAMVLCRGTTAEATDAPHHDHEHNSEMPDLMHIARAYDAPIMVTSKGTIEATNTISNFTAKMHIGDPERVAAAIAHYEPHIDFDALLDGL